MTVFTVLYEQPINLRRTNLRIVPYLHGSFQKVSLGKPYLLLSVSACYIPIYILFLTFWTVLGPLMTHISIVLPSRNTVGTIGRAIECFLDQSHKDKSLIIVDSTSDDGTHELLTEYANLPEVTWISQPERGLSHAINMGIANVPNGAIFGYLGADDFMEPGTLERVSDHFETNPDHVGLFFDSYTARAGQDPVYRSCPAETFSKENLLKFRSVAGMQNTFLRADIAKTFLFDESVRLAMDYELFLRLAHAGYGERIVRCPHASTINTADGNLSRTFKRASKREALAWALHYAPPGRAKLRAWLKFLKYRWV